MRGDRHERHINTALRILTACIPKQTNDRETKSSRPVDHGGLRGSGLRRGCPAEQSRRSDVLRSSFLCQFYRPTVTTVTTVATVAKVLRFAVDLLICSANRSGTRLFHVTFGLLGAILRPTRFFVVASACASATGSRSLQPHRFRDYERASERGETTAREEMEREMGKGKWNGVHPQ